MLFILFAIIMILPTLTGWGKFLEIIFKTRFTEGVSGKMMFGILGISLLWTILAFFIPLDLWVEIPTISWGLFHFFKEKIYLEFYRFSNQKLCLVLLSSAVIIFCSSFYPYILDHFGYYVPSILWLREIGLVRGIANLDLVLGQMSIWHIFQAGFSNFADPFLRINGVLLIIYTLYITEKKSWIQLCFIPILFLFSQSPSPDLPVIVFSLILLQEMISGNKNTSLLFAFSLFVFAVKPTMIWLPILSFLYTVFITRSHFKNLLPGILVLFLFLFKNIWTFGYPVFPVSVIDLGLSWKPNSELLKSSSEYAAVKTFDNQYSYAEIRKFSISEYIRNWFFLDGIKSFINSTFIISLLIFIIFTCIKKKKIITFICFSLVIKSMIVLIFSAQYRFFIDVFFVIFFMMLYDMFNTKRSIAIFSVLTLIFVNFIVFPTLISRYITSYRMSSFMGPFEWTQLYKPSVYKYSTYNSYEIGNLKFNITEKYPFNFDTPVPAISESFIFDYQKAGIFPQLMDKNNIRKGFISKKTTPEDRKKLKKITRKIKNSYQ